MGRILGCRKKIAGKKHADIPSERNVDILFLIILLLYINLASMKLELISNWLMTQTDWTRGTLVVSSK
jgi:hypothetical protein